MTPKERMVSAFNFIHQDDIVPFWELEFHLYKEMLGREPLLGFEFGKLSGKEKDYALNLNAQILVETAEKLGYCAIRAIGGYWEVSPGVPAYLWIDGEENQLKLVKILKRLAGDKYLIIGNAGGFIGIPDGNHLMELVSDLYERPGELKKQAENMLEKGMEYGYRMVEAGAECILNCTDHAFNSGPFMSLQQFDEFVAPYLYRWTEAFRKAGVYTMMHSDGNLMPILDRIVGSGVNALQCIDPIAGMDIISLKKQLYGKTCLVGNTNCSLLQFGPAKEIEKSVKDVVENCRTGGGFVLSACNVIFRGIPVEHYMVMVETYKKFGRFDNMKM